MNFTFFFWNLIMRTDMFISTFRYSGWGLNVILVVNVFCSFVTGQIRYSIPEEVKKGSLIGNVAQDLGLDLKRLRTGRAHIVTGENTQYAELKIDKGTVVVNERIDREELCGDITPCSFSFEIILENPIELHRAVVEITDVNDHPPTFQNEHLTFEISESALPGSRFVLEGADDPDVGINTLQSYFLTPNDYFVLKEHTNPDGSKFAEMVIQKPLDREQHPYLSLKLIAVDGGLPQRSGSVSIEVTVLDANDNAPVFNQTVYRASVVENALKGTYITTVNATDADSGSNGKITFYFSKLKGTVADIFSIDENSGIVSVLGQIDYEKDKKYEIRVEAKDQGGLTDSTKIIIEVIDVNDNAPVITTMSFNSLVSEDSPPGTTVAVIKIKDSDSEDNGQVICSINKGLPFQIHSSLSNYYNLVTDGHLDREAVAEYNITLTATDSGSPSLSSSVTFHLSLSDINDNAPVFEKQVYSVYVNENNSPGLSLFTVSAKDSDCHQNSRISYFLVEQQIGGTPVSSFVSINAETGVLHAGCSFDYEQIKQLTFDINAQDGGSPSLSSNASIHILIQDQNDNAPQILYPVHTTSSQVSEIVPRSAEVGYLVTKVVAVDVDSRQNAWLSYKLQKATDRALFEVGLQNGEIRTVRQVTDKDAVKQKLTVVVEDNGQPSRSATVNINVAVADSFPEEFTDFTHEKDYNDDITFYLILALAVVSFLFIVSIIAILSVKCYRWRQERIFYNSTANLPVIPYYPPLYADVGGTGTLQHVHSYDAYRTTDSRKSDVRYVRPPSESVTDLGTHGKQTFVQSQWENLTSDSKEQQKPPNTDWRFTQNQRPGPSGAAATPEVAMGTGPWPNPPTEAEQLQALMAAANEVSEATNTLGPGTMGLSTRYSPQFTLQHVPDYRQNVYIPGSTATLTAGGQQIQPLPPQQALPPPQTPDGQGEPPKAQTPACKKKSTKKEKK
ncbi:protocadherin gamma-A11-like isoform X4 [Brachyhypopomus gauderio]|uniref:protocadherin gamma-A11-like isoform X4 n=1 Tax=Brachyhypopomus gauderio TaxID=698409 RepID=UPI00404187BD